MNGFQILKEIILCLGLLLAVTAGAVRTARAEKTLPTLRWKSTFERGERLYEMAYFCVIIGIVYVQPIKYLMPHNTAHQERSILVGTGAPWHRWTQGELQKDKASAE